MRTLKHVVLLKSKAQMLGGLEKYAARIALAFASKGAKVSLLTTGEEHPLSQFNEISVHSCKTSPWPSFLRMEQFDHFVREWIQKNQPDLIFGMDRNRFQTHIRAGNGVHASYLKSRVHTEGKLKHLICLCNPMHRKILELEKAAFENPRLEKLFANSHMVRHELLEHYNIDPKKIQVIHNGVEWEEMQELFYPENQSLSDIRQHLRLKKDCFQFLFIGNGYLRKGLEVLLQALPRLKNQNFQLSVVGKENRLQYFQAKTIELGLKDRVLFFGSQENITPFYQAADALVIPSFYDPFANVTVEALAMGLFTISSKNNGACEIIHDGNGTIIEDLLNMDCLQDALEKALKHPKTKKSASFIRNSVKHLDFSKQLNQLVYACE